jgi:DnaJ-class molecular chaperone
MPIKDYYKILSIAFEASDTEIKKAYRRLSMIWHPDKNTSPNAHEKFIEITEAYEILIDPIQRKNYDILFKDAFYDKQKPQEICEDYLKEKYQQFNKDRVRAAAKAEETLKQALNKKLTVGFHYLNVILNYIFWIAGILLLLFFLFKGH